MRASDRVDVADAAAMPGVAGAWAAADLDLPAHHGLFVLNQACARPPLATDRVRFVGEAVAVVAAATPAEAEDAAGAVVVEYDELPAVVDPEAALAEGAPLQFADVGSNLAAGLDGGPEDPLAGAEVVARLRMVSPRVAVVPMEADAILAVPGDGRDDYDLTVWVSTQMPHAFANSVAKVLDLDRERLRVITPHVGGGFGAKAGLAHEHTVVVALARRLGRPVRWIQDRSDNMIGMPHGRGQVHYVEMGLDRDGIIQGLRARVVGDSGAYAGFGGALALGPTRMMAAGPYRIPNVRFAAAAALTNTTPVGAFRGAGRPEAAQYLERLLDVAAGEVDLDPVELRRRNLLAPDEFPATTAVGTTYDTGAYADTLEAAVRAAGYDELRAEQAERRARRDRRVLGIGVGTYVEVTAGGMTSEYASLDVHADGTATLGVGTSAHGQGHATAFAMIVADRLGLPVDAVQVVESDTAVIPRGQGTGGSRSLQVGGGATHRAADEVWQAARRLAARRLEAAEDDIVVTDGRVGVAGVPARALEWAELAAAADEEGTPLAWAGDVDQGGATFPFGSHVAVVEVDLDTGRVVPLRHVAVDDCGRIVNPLIVTGQQHGGIAQGVAQALWEEVVFDSDGNPRTATLADYEMPSAAELPSFEASHTETPTTVNALGAKGIGESGTIGSTPAVHNAVVDALSHLGVRHIDMPCTPEKVWRAVRDAEAGTPPPLWRDPPAIFDQLPRLGEGEGGREGLDI